MQKTVSYRVASLFNLELRKLSDFGGLTTADKLVLLSVAPFLAVMLVDINSFILGWNQGRGGLTFVLLFLAIEWSGARNILAVNSTKKRLIAFATAVALMSSYYFGVFALDFQRMISEFAIAVNVDQGAINWPWTWEYFFVAAYFTAVVVVLFGFAALREISVPTVYSIGMGAILSLDSFFPYGSIGFLQDWVSVIWNLVLVLLQLSGVTVMTNPLSPAHRPWVYLAQNRLFISGKTGAMTLAIFWPSSGIVSMLIYSTIIATLLIKLEAPLRRKILYAVAGALGTFFVNVVRVFLISYYVAFISVDVNAFHEVIGEILFIPWVIVYLLSVFKVENLFARQGPPLLGFAQGPRPVPP